MIMQPMLIQEDKDALLSVFVEELGEIKTQAVTTQEALEPVVAALKASPIIGLDTETTGLDYMRDQLHGVSVATETEEWYICDSALYFFLPMLADLATDNSKLWVGHNFKFDLHFLEPKGFRPAKVADTMIAQWLVDENMELSLKSLAATRLARSSKGLPTFKDLQKIAKKGLGVKRMEEVTIFDIPSNVLADYAARDARLTYDLWKVLEYDLEQEGVADTFWNSEMPFMWLLLDMESNGIYINPSGVAELDRDLNAGLEEARAKWNAITGGINPNSTLQLREFLFGTLKLPKQGKTKAGEASVDALTLQRLESKDKSGAVAALQELRKYEKLISTYVSFLKENPVENRVHGSFNQVGTVTGRLSSSNPNLQNIPSHGELGKKIKKVFSAPKGYKLIDIDYSQIELRTLASDANEPNFIKVFAEGGDPHQMTADLAHVARSVGKAQPLDALILTPDGWKRMGEIHEGGYVIGTDGKPAKVLSVFPQGVRPIYRITFNDGTWVECDLAHLWNVRRSEKEKWETMTLNELMRANGGSVNGYEVPLPDPVEMPKNEAKTVSQYYVEGARASNSPDGIRDPQFLQGSIAQRWALLHGIMISKGSAVRGKATVAGVSEIMQDQLLSLVRSLGGVATLAELDGEPCVKFAFKEGVWKYEYARITAVAHKQMESAQYMGDREAQCILVNNADHLYLTNSYTVTHNTLNFAWAYGAGPRKLADTIEKTGAERPKETETREWLDSFDAAYPAFGKYKRDLINTARRQGYVTTFGGRKRRLSDINSPVQGLRGAAERQAVNSRIQGSAADMLKWAMLELQSYCQWYGVRMIAQVHDELLFEVPEELADEFAKYAQQVMESIQEHFELKVRVEAEPGVGDNWAEAKG